MEATDKDLILLESMLGTPIQSKENVQIRCSYLPIPFPLEFIHYEFYENHIELHIESKKSCYNRLCTYLKTNLPNNDIAKEEERNFCEFAYVLNRRIEGWSNVEELGYAIIELRNIVEPVLERYCEQIAEDFELAKVLGDFYDEQEAALPFHINVIDELHATENAHTRILTHLLKYKEDGKYVILSSFLKQIPMFNVDSFDIEKSKVCFNRDNIDGLIEKEGEYAVIIENKIHWAVDQDKQIERYVTTEIDNGIPKDNIWVIYLTRDGRKKVEDYSLTETTKNILGNRFVEMDYYHNILPWLKESILPNCRLREEWLVSAIKQYIDHLEGLFDIRDSRKDFVKRVQGRISKSIGCTNDMSRHEVYSRLNSYNNTLVKLQNVVGNWIESLIKPIADHFQNTTMKVMDELCPDVEIALNNQIQSGYLQLLNKKWTNKVHFEWIPLNKENLLSGSEYIFVLHVEQNDIQNSFVEVLNDSDVASEARGIGLEIDSRDKRVVYKNVIKVIKPMSDMTDEEMTSFLHEAYKDVNAIIAFVSKYILDKESEI